MDKNVLRAIDGVAVYPLISFAIFFLFFLGLLAYVLLVKPTLVHTMAALPLADAEVAAEVACLAGRKGGPVC